MNVLVNADVQVHVYIHCIHVHVYKFEFQNFVYNTVLVLDCRCRHIRSNVLGAVHGHNWMYNMCATLYSCVSHNHNMIAQSCTCR